MIDAITAIDQTNPAIARAENQPRPRLEREGEQAADQARGRDEQQHHPHAADRKHVAEATDRVGSAQGASAVSRFASSGCRISPSGSSTTWLSPLSSIIT